MASTSIHAHDLSSKYRIALHSSKNICISFSPTPKYTGFIMRLAYGCSKDEITIKSEAKPQFSESVQPPLPNHTFTEAVLGPSMDTC